MGIWGIDLGGTKVECAVLGSPSADDVIVRRRIATESKIGYHHIIDRIKLLVDEVSIEIGESPSNIGIGTPGVSDPSTGLQKNSNTTCLNDMPFHSDLQTALGIPVTMANDANCFALAEARMGVVPEVVPDARVVFGVIMGTGVGGGVIVDGKPIVGRHGIGGEWGHNYLHDSGGPCYCGKYGCTEKVISGTALQKFYEAQSGIFRKLPEIVERARGGSDTHATSTMNRLVKHFGRGIATIINVLDPDAIVLGGGVGNIDLLYTRGVEEASKHLFNNKLETPFLKPKLGDSAGVFGAALLVA